MPGYAILRFEKHHGSAGGIEAHHERLKDEYKSNPDIHKNRSGQNIHLIAPQGRYSQEIRARIDAARQRNPKLAVKSNSVRFVDTLITASPDYFFGRPDGYERKYFQTALRFFEEKVTPENIVSAVVHMDEETPHMHLVFVPLTADDRLSAKEIIGGPAGCRKWQDEFYAKMSKAFPDLMRGRAVELTGRKHLPSDVFKAAVKADRIDERLRVGQEILSLRRYVKAIPDHLKAAIADYGRQERQGRQARQRDER